MTEFVGWICSYTPEEIIVASGLLPFRILPQREISISSSYLPSNFCPYIRRILNSIFENSTKLKGLIFVYSCDGMRRLKDVCDLYWKKGFVFGIDLPRKQDKKAEEFLLTQFKNLKNFLESYTGKPIEDKDLWNAIQVQNKIKDLIFEIYNKIVKNESNITLKELTNVVKEIGFRSKKEDFISYLEDLKKDQKTLKSDLTSKPKVLIYGSVIEDLQLYEIIESCGAQVILEDSCNFLRYFDEKVSVSNSISPLEALVKRYLYKIPCPRMTDLKKRLERILQIYQKYKCQGIIFHSLKFCDLMSLEITRLQNRFKDLNIPFLHIEREEIPDATGQIKTRIQAFIEMIKNERN